MKKKFDKNNLPNEIPIFPLSNVIFFPDTLLPLNIFEPRYKQMTEYALNENGLIGMVQSKEEVDDQNRRQVYDIGCVGYIEYHSDTPDGRYLINLKGVSRFKIKNEIQSKNLFRSFEVQYDDFVHDIREEKVADLDTMKLIDKTKKLFDKSQLVTDWRVIEKVEPGKLINSLAMICPFTVSEKQSLLETQNLMERNEVLNQIINFYILGDTGNNQNVH